jgi:hypothetical protein
MIPVYTCILGGYDRLRDDQCREGAHFYVFSDHDPHSDTWTCRPAHRVFKSPRRDNRWHKMLPHILFPDAEYSIYIDGTLELLRPAQWYIDTYLQAADIAALTHPSRHGFRDEAQRCLQVRKGDPDEIRRQVARYLQDGCPQDTGLVEASFLVRRHSAKVREFNERWLTELTIGCERDQISFPYLAWKMDMRVALMPTKTLNPDIRYEPHRRFKWLGALFDRLPVRW